MREIRHVLLGVLLCALTGTVAWAQATAQISGTVKDPSGAVVPNVEVTATQTDTGLSRKTTANETGAYILPNLPLGPYRLEAAASGFKTRIQTGILLQVNDSPEINLTLEVGEVGESLQVEASAELVETRTQGVGQVVDSERVVDLPLNGRNVTDLIILAGGATPSDGNGGFGGATISTSNPINPFSLGKPTYSIAGGLDIGINFTLDGASYVSPANGLDLPFPFPDALQEFKVETSALSAQYGTHSAGAVNGVTRSGTNEYHGDVFEFVRNYLFNARNFFAPQRDNLKRNQYGGTVGGPIMKNKLFFFAGWQGTRVRQSIVEPTAFVPTAAMLAGNFTAFASPACNGGRQLTLGPPFVNNQINPAFLSPVSLKIVSNPSWPQPSNQCGAVNWTSPNDISEDQVVARLDYQLTPTHSLFVRYVADNLTTPSPYTSDLLTTAVNQASFALAQMVVIGDTYLFSPTVVNSFRLTANRVANNRVGNNYFDGPDVGINMYTYNSNPADIVFLASGAFTIGALQTNSGRTNFTTFGLNEDLSVVRGNHQITVGVSSTRTNYDFYQHGLSGGDVQFTGAITRSSLGDFLLGVPLLFLQSPEDEQFALQWTLGLYAQDSWKVTPRLTLNYGLRWEPYFPQERLDGGVDHFLMSNFLAGTRSTQFVNAPVGLIYPGDPGFQGGNAGAFKEWKDFSPRVGLAWDPFGDGRTSIRASYGIFYDLLPIQSQIGNRIVPPWDPLVIQIAQNWSNPYKNFPGGNPFPITLGPNVTFAPFSSYVTLNYNTRNPQIGQWNLSVQRQIGSNWRIAANYLGSESSHLPAEQDLNPAIYIPGNCVAGQYGLTAPGPCSTAANTDHRLRLTLLNPTSTIGHLNTIDDGGTASYNALLLTVERRYSHGVTINANYTWSHCISDPFSGVLGVGGGGGYEDPTNRRFSRGDCYQSASDIRQVFNLSAVAETPRFSNNILRAVATGWSLSPIVKIQSGQPLTITTAQDIALNNTNTQRVDQVLPNVYLNNGSVNNYLNPAAFAHPAVGTLSNMGVASVRGPLFWELDAALVRTFQIRERFKLQLRGEAFNLTNSLRRENPVTNFDAPNFGQIVTAYDPRIMQFAFKFLF